MKTHELTSLLPENGLDHRNYQFIPCSDPQSVNEVDLDYEKYSYMQDNQKSHLNLIIFIKIISARFNYEWIDYS